MKVYAIVSGYYPDRIHHLYDPLYYSKDQALNTLHEICDTLNLNEENNTHLEHKDFEFSEYKVNDDKMYIYHDMRYNGKEPSTSEVISVWIEVRNL